MCLDAPVWYAALPFMPSSECEILRSEPLAPNPVPWCREYEDNFQMHVSAAVALMESAHESLPSLDSLTVALTAVAKSVTQRIF